MDTFKHGSGWCCAWCNREDDERDAEMASQALVPYAQPVQPAQYNPMFTKPQLEIIKASVTDSADINPHQEYEDIIQRVDDLLRDC